MRRPYDITKAPHWLVIHRCIHFRGTEQDKAVAELHDRGLWLTKDQWDQAGRVADQAQVAVTSPNLS